MFGLGEILATVVFMTQFFLPIWLAKYISNLVVFVIPGDVHDGLMICYMIIIWKKLFSTYSMFYIQIMHIGNMISDHCLCKHCSLSQA